MKAVRPNGGKTGYGRGVTAAWLVAKRTVVHMPLTPQPCTVVATTTEKEFGQAPISFQKASFELGTTCNTTGSYVGIALSLYVCMCLGDKLHDTTEKNR